MRLYISSGAAADGSKLIQLLMSKCGGRPLGDGGALPAFATPERSFVIEPSPDALPGNAVDLPKADLCIIVVNSASGLAQEARRHIAVAGAVGARHVVLAIDGLDDAGWDRSRFQRIAEEFVAFAAGFAFASALAVPLSLVGGDNVVEPSPNTPWYKGLTLLAHLVRVPVDPQRRQRPLRLAVKREAQCEGAQSLLHAELLSGTLHRHSLVSEPLSGITAKINRILVDGGKREIADPGESVTLELDRTLDIREGEILADPQHLPHVTEQFAAQLVWLGAEALLPGRDYLLRIGGREIVATATSLKYRLDIETMLQQPARTLQSGEIGALTLATAGQLALDAFADVPQTGRFTLSDRYSHALIAVGTVDFVLRRGVNVHLQPLTVSKPTRTSLKGHGPCILWFTGLSGAGKSTIANLVEVQLARRGSHTYLLDGDNVRHGLNKNLGFTAADRVENIRRVGEVAKLFVDAGLIVLCSFISPFRAERATVRSLVEPGEFIEIFVRAPLAVCEDRDPKGLYAKSRAGELPNFTGIDSPYEEPEAPDLVLDTASTPAAELAQRVLALLETRELIGPDNSKIL